MKIFSPTRFLLLLFFAAAYVSGKNFEKQETPGITSKRIFSMARDSLGYMWLGTDEGLNRFDGIRITNYRSNVFDSTTISSNRVWEVFVDNENKVWVLNDRGVDLYNRADNNFIRFKTPSRPLHLTSTGDSLIVSTKQNGLLVIDKKTMDKSWFSFDPLDPMSISSSRFSGAQTSPVSIRKSIAWVGTTNGLNKINFTTGSAKRFYKEKSELVESDTILTVLDFGGELLIGTSGGLIAHNETSGQTTQLSNHHTNRIVKTDQGTEFIALGHSKSFLFDKDKNILNSTKHSTPKTEVLYLGDDQYLLWSKHDVEIIMLERENNRWSWGKGFAPVVPEEILFDPENNIWIASKDGLFVGSNTDIPTSFVKHNSGNSRGIFAKAKNKHIIYKEGQLFETASSDFSKVSQTRGINTKETMNGAFERPDGDIFLFNKKIYHVSNGQTKEIAAFDEHINAVASNKDYLLASIKNSGIVAVDLLSGETYDYRENRLLMKYFPTGASCIYIEGAFAWVGSEESGLYEYDMSRVQKPTLIKHHVYNSEDSQSFSSSSVSCLQPQNGQLFIGTNGDGIFYHLGKGKFDKITFKDGLPSNNIISLAPSSDSLLWALTKEGISLINTADKEIKNLSAREGIGNFIESQNSLVSTENGNALILAGDGHYYVDKNLIYMNEHEELVVIESVSLIDKNNKVFPSKKENIRVTHLTPTVNISFTSPSYYKPTETTYSFMVDGYHDSWVDNGTRRNIELRGMSPGTYTTWIKSYNSDGYESKNIAQIDFRIVPPPWKTWWAYLVYVVTTLAVFAYYVKYQKEAHAKASDEKRKEKELEEARQFQEDMLPKKMPDTPLYDITAVIKTSTEVGGDYYDFFQQDDGSLYVVCGDATGHGMTAGMMVSITKAGLYGIPAIPTDQITNRLNRVIKNIELGYNRMALNVSYFKNGQVQFTSAGMPPAYHCISSSGEVKEVLQVGLPLGSMQGEHYNQEEYGFASGDTLVFLSDGLPEAVNANGDLLGYEAVMDCISNNKNEDVETVKNSLLDLGDNWLGGGPPQDDITIVVVKKK